MNAKVHNTIHDTLMAANPFKYLNKLQMKQVQDFGQFLTFSNEDILQQGKPGLGLFVILNGKVNISVIALGRGKISLAQLSQGNIFGEVSLLQNSPCTASVRAHQKVECFLLERTCYDAFYTLMPEIRYLINRSLIEDVAHRQREMLDTIKQLMRYQNESKCTRLNSSRSNITKLSIEERLDKFSYLHQLPIFKSFTKDEFYNFLESVQIIEASKRYAVIKNQQTDCPCYFVVSGSVHGGIESDKHRARFAVHGPNTLICPPSFIDKKPEMFDYITNDPSVLLKINTATLEKQARENPLFWYKCFDLFCKYIVSLQIKLNNLMVRLTNEKLETIIKE